MRSEVHEGNQSQNARQREHIFPPTKKRPPQIGAALLGALVALTLIPACATALPPVDYSKEPDPRQSEYVVGPSDVLKVNVWKAPDLSVEVTVRPDGTVTLPLIGDLKAAERTPSQLRGEIKRRLTAFLKDDNPTIEVIVAEANSYRFTVAGNVERAGLFTSKHYVTVSEALALAGGPNRYADLDHVVIVRHDKEGSRTIPLSMKLVYSGQRPDMDLVILTEDRIFVP